MKRAIRLIITERPASTALIEAAAMVTEAIPIHAPYRNEISLAVRAWIAELAQRLTQGAMILLDYGLPRHELYHPQRDGGTVRCQQWAPRA